MKLQIATYKTLSVPESMVASFQPGDYVAQCSLVPWDARHGSMSAYGATPEEASEKLVQKVLQYHKVAFSELRVVEVEL